MGAKRVTDMRWPVAKSYDIRHKASAGSKRILHTASAEVERWYNPLEDKKLPWEFARVTDDQSLRVFAHKCGELGYHYIEDIIASSEYYNDRINLPGEPAEWILKHAEQVRVFRRLYGLLRRTLEEWDRIDDRASVSSNKIEQCPDWSSLPQSLSEEVTQAMRELRDTTPGATIETHKDGTETTGQGSSR